MIEKLAKYLTYGNRFCGVEYTNENEQDIYYTSLLKQTKKELVEDSFFNTNSIEKISENIPKHQHIFLTINTDKVLVKTIESEQQDHLKLVYKAFPNIDTESFYYEVLSQENIHFVALCRRDYVDAIISKFSESKLNVIDFSLGHSLAGILTNFASQNVVYSSNSKIEITDTAIRTIKKEEPASEHYDINGLKVSNQYLLSFIGAIQNVLKSDFSNTNFTLKKEQLVNEYKHTRFFNQFLKFGGIFILGLLLINFLVFNHYFNKVNELGQISELNQATKTKIITLDKSVSKKEKMINDILKGNTSKTSFYNDRIISDLPKSILLSDLEYQPLLKRINKEKPIEINKGIIRIAGTSDDSEVFSDWITQLERLEWVDKVDIIDYGTESRSVSDFQIKVALHYD